MLGWGLRTTRDRLVAALPRDATPIERQNLRRAFECVIQRAEAGDVDEEQLGALSRACAAAVEDRRLADDELREIDALLHRLCPGTRP